MSMLKAGRPSQYKEKAINSVKEAEKETIRMNVNLPKSFYKIIKQAALDLDKTVTQLTTEALSEYLSKRS